MTIVLLQISLHRERDELSIWLAIFFVVFRCSPGFQMQSKQARLDPLHGISIPNSSSALILLQKCVCLDHTWHERWTRLSFLNGSLRSVTLCARNWSLVHHQTKTNTSMKSLPRLLFSLHRSHLIVRISIFQICRTSVSLWDLLYFWWNANCLSNSSPWIQMLAM